LSNLARALEGAAAVRHRVKQMDRLLGSRALQRECASVYAMMARYWLRGNDTPLVVVDWSDLNASHSAQMIRASLALAGRSLTLYEEVHSMKAATTPEVHKAFLARLKSMLPPGCQPIVITDAGFRSPWFRAVEAQGWHWVGRSRNRDLLRAHGEPVAAWRGFKRLYAQATGKALDLGLFDCVRNRPHVASPHPHQESPQGAFHAHRQRGEEPQQSQPEASPRAGRTVAVGASTSLSHLSAQAIVAIYTQRMQIEQAFRDTKNARFRLGLSDSASRTPERLTVLALIASLAEFVLRLIGQCAINHHLQYDLQLTNRKTHPEISVIRVGRLLVDSALAAFSASEFRRTMQAWIVPYYALQV
jgi:Transposase DDE domain